MTMTMTMTMTIERNVYGKELKIKFTFKTLYCPNKTALKFKCKRLSFQHSGGTKKTQQQQQQRNVHSDQTTKYTL
jgi:hypothetical protein